MSAEVVTRKRGRPRKTPPAPANAIIAEESSLAAASISSEASAPSQASAKRVARKKPAASDIEGSQSATREKTATVSKAALAATASKGNPAPGKKESESRASASEILAELKASDSKQSKRTQKAVSTATAQLKDSSTSPGVVEGEDRKEVNHNKTESALPDTTPLNRRTEIRSPSSSSPPALALPSESAVEESSQVSFAAEDLAESSPVRFTGSPATTSRIIDALRDREGSLGESSRVISKASSAVASARKPDSPIMAAASSNSNRSASSSATSTTSPSTPENRPRVLSQQDIKGLGSIPRRSTVPPKAKDIRQTKEYKTAARRWVSTIVALPILVYTSWVLYERVYGGQKPKHLIDRPVPAPAVTPQAQSETSELSASKTAPK